MSTIVFRAEAVGSMLRPRYLKRARASFEAGGLTGAELTRTEDRAVEEAIALQEGVGLDVVTDGEMRRGTSWRRCTRASTGPSPPQGRRCGGST